MFVIGGITPSFYCLARILEIVFATTRFDLSLSLGRMRHVCFGTLIYNIDCHLSLRVGSWDSAYDQMTIEGDAQHVEDVACINVSASSSLSPVPSSVFFLLRLSVSRHRLNLLIRLLSLLHWTHARYEGGSPHNLYLNTPVRVTP